MEAVEIYDKLIESYKAGNKARTGYYAEQWFALNLENPFADGTPESDLYLNAQLCYSRFARQAISCRRARLDVHEYGAEIAKLDLPNPYKKVVLEEPMHVFGVIPEELVEPENAAAAVETLEAVASETTKDEIQKEQIRPSEKTTEPAKEPAEESKPKKHAFSKHRKG